MVLLAPTDSRADDFPVDEDTSFAITVARLGQSAHSPAYETRWLSALEQSVVALSLFDAVSTTKPPGVIQRFLSGAFGIEPANRLADKRLEVLRRYCILLRAAAGEPDAGEQAALRRCGFSEEKIREIGALIGRASLRLQARTAGEMERV